MRQRLAPHAALLTTGVALALASCGRGPPLERSCEGRLVDTCDPYTYAEVAEASFDPGGLSPGDPRETARVRFTLRTCGANTPSAPSVQIAAVIDGAGGSAPFDAQGVDGGFSGSGDDTRIYQLTSVRASSADATTIEATIENPFDGRVPTSRDIALRFTPVIAGCEGGALTVPYRTGGRPGL